MPSAAAAVPDSPLLAHSGRQIDSRNYAAPRRPSLSVFLASHHPKTDADGRQAEGSGGGVGEEEVTNGFSLHFSGVVSPSPSLPRSRSHRKNLRNFPATDRAAAAADNDGR